MRNAVIQNKQLTQEEESAKQAIFAMAEKAKEKAKNKPAFLSVRDKQYKDN